LREGVEVDVDSPDIARWHETGEMRQVGADVVLDHNPGATAAPYAGRVAGDDLLLGSRYALIRRELRKAMAPRVVNESATTLLVTLGGAPPAEVADALRRALDGSPSLGVRVEWLTGGDDVVGPMQRADVAISGAGVTASELCGFGVPAVLVVLADNQRPIAEELTRAGAAITADADGAVGEAVRLAGDAAARRAMAEAGQRLVDGRGALRVAARLRAELLGLRDATEDDARLLFEWVNDPVVRATSLSRAPVPWDTHVAWLQAKLADPQCRLWIVEDNAGEPLGQVRFDQHGTAAEISIGLSAEQRGRGLGPAAIDAAVRRFFAESDVSLVEARIRPDNAASITAFGDACFEFVGEASDEGASWLQYARRR
jgi:RimJ/RimL family protein N-acetyltransferase